MTYEDHFSGQAYAYARHRPRYPDELFAWLASGEPRTRAGLGRRHRQRSGGSGSRGVFDQVVATDASSDQLAHAERHERVEYRNETAGRSSLPPASAGLITAGAAAHWFELDDFYREVRRVGKGAVIALFSYGPRDFADAFTLLLGDPIVHRFQENVLAGYWPERIQYVHDRYATLPFPFDEIAAPPFAMTAGWNLPELLAFLDTWSASQRYFEQRGTRATDDIAPELAHAWGDPSRRRHLERPLFLSVGRV